MVDTIYLLIILNIIMFVIGYLLGRLNTSSPAQVGTPLNYMFKSAHINNSSKTIEIDDKTFVTAINIDGIEKKYETLGDTKSSTENIELSVNKLKNFKR